MLNALLDPTAGSSSFLAQATGEGYSASSPPDYLAVSTGSSVTPDYAGGYNSVGWDFGGADVTFFSTGAAERHQGIRDHLRERRVTGQSPIDDSDGAELSQRPSV
jgi:hypothetical protein